MTDTAMNRLARKFSFVIGITLLFYFLKLALASGYTYPEFATAINFSLILFLIVPYLLMISQSLRQTAWAKTLASAAKKLEKNRVEEDEAEQAARALQKEANEAFEARLERRVTAEMRSFEDVQKDVLKALKKLDKAVESADEETAKSQGAYQELLSIMTPSN